MSGRQGRVAVTGYAGWFARGEGSVCLGPAASLRAETLRHGALSLPDLVAVALGPRGLPYPPGRIAVVFSSSKGRLARFNGADPFAWTADAAGAEIARSFPIAGPFLSPNAACASGAHAVALGAQLIEDGRADLVIAGAEEPPAPEPIVAAYRRIGALSREGVMRPFDRRRDGFVPNSGAAVLVLERSESAQHGFVSGWSMMADATHMTAMTPSGETVARAVRRALAMAGREAVDYINAHGTATHLNDVMEARAIRSVFGTRVPVSATKAWTGHLLGAAGAVEAVICLMAMREGFAPPTLNLEEGEFELDCVAGVGREMGIGSALSVSYGFGGHIGAVVLES